MPFIGTLRLKMKSDINCTVMWITISTVTTHTQRKKAENEHLQFGESDYLFTRQIKHFVMIWHNDKRQRELSLNVTYFVYIINPLTTRTYTHRVHLLISVINDYYVYPIHHSLHNNSWKYLNQIFSLWENKPNSVVLQSIKVSSASAHRCLLDPGSQGAIKHMFQSGGQPNVRPSMLVPKQTWYSFYRPWRDERLNAP